MHIQSHYAEAQKTGRRDGNGGLSARTVLHHHRILRQALKQAVRWRMIALDPTDAVVAPKPEHKEVAPTGRGADRCASRSGRRHYPLHAALAGCDYRATSR